MSPICLRCSECIKSNTANICPIMNCPKGLVNGPCGGSNGGCCEISADKPCTWMEIFKNKGTKSIEITGEPLQGLKDYSLLTKKTLGRV